MRASTKLKQAVIVELCNAGHTVQEVADQVGLSRQRTDILAKESGQLLPRKVREAHRKARAQTEARAQRPEIQRLMATGMSASQIAKELSIDPATTLEVYRDIRRAEGGRKEMPQRFSDGDIRNCLRWAARGKPLSVCAYEDYRIGRVLPSGELWPSALTIMRRGGTWIEACKSAGIESCQRAKGAGRPQEFSRHDCVEALIQTSNGKPPTITEYNERKAEGMPSAMTIRLRFGRWSAAIAEAEAAR